MKRASGLDIVGYIAISVAVVLVASAVVPRVFYSRWSGHGDSDVMKARADLAALSHMLELFREDTGRYPTNEEGLEVLLQWPDGVSNWKGPYSRYAILADPWGRAYIYRTKSALATPSFQVMSYGADGVEGGDGRNTDLIEEQVLEVGMPKSN